MSANSQIHGRTPHPSVYTLLLQVAERGLAFVRTFSELLAAQQADGRLPPLFREAWAHSACVSLAKTTCAQFAAAKHVASPPLVDEQPPAAADRQERPVGCVHLGSRLSCSKMCDIYTCPA